MAVLNPTPARSAQATAAYSAYACHIMDPRAGQSAEGTLVAVEAPRNIDSEAWMKACFVNGRIWAAYHPMEGARVFYYDGACGAWAETQSEERNCAVLTM
jgi:thiamine biosynthesis lipoprotein ApbE